MMARRSEPLDQTEANELGDLRTTGGSNGAATDTVLSTVEAPADLASILAERDDYLDQLKRSLADFANFRRRVDQERSQAREYATRDLLRQFIPIVDDLRRALSAVSAVELERPWVQGVQLIERKLQAVLEKEGVTPIEALGQPFDPALHEAVATEPGSTGAFVVEVYQTGYLQGQHLLRPAMVKVGNATES